MLLPFPQPDSHAMMVPHTLILHPNEQVPLEGIIEIDGHFKLFFIDIVLSESLKSAITDGYNITLIFLLIKNGVNEVYSDNIKIVVMFVAADLKRQNKTCLWQQIVSKTVCGWRRKQFLYTNPPFPKHRRIPPSKGNPFSMFMGEILVFV